MINLLWRGRPGCRASEYRLPSVVFGIFVWHYRNWRKQKITIYTLLDYMQIVTDNSLRTVFLNILLWWQHMWLTEWFHIVLHQCWHNVFSNRTATGDDKAGHHPCVWFGPHKEGQSEQTCSDVVSWWSSWGGISYLLLGPYSFEDTPSCWQQSVIRLCT